LLPHFCDLVVLLPGTNRVQVRRRKEALRGFLGRGAGRGVGMSIQKERKR
jgi:hypothetical protein